MLEDCIDEIYDLATLLTSLSPLVEIFGTFGGEMAHYEIYDFEAVESLLKKVRNLLEHSGKRIGSSSLDRMFQILCYVNVYGNYIKNAFHKFDGIYFDFGV